MPTKPNGLIARQLTISRSPTLSLKTQKIRKAVFPVAGLGTRFLPATKAIPKEMLPAVDRRLIQYAVNGACVSVALAREDMANNARAVIERALHRS